MTYNEKKSLYESIMKDVAKIVKRRLNELNDMNSFTMDFHCVTTQERGKITIYGVNPMFAADAIIESSVLNLSDGLFVKYTYDRLAIKQFVRDLDAKSQNALDDLINDLFTCYNTGDNESIRLTLRYIKNILADKGFTIEYEIF